MAKSSRRGGAAGAGGRRKETEFEVEDAQAPKGPGAGLETGLVFVTFIALLVGIALCQLELSESFGKGLLG